MSKNVKKYDNHELNLSTGLHEDLSKYFKCRSCGWQFDSLGDMERHIMVDHIQKGDIPKNNHINRAEIISEQVEWHMILI